MADPLKYWEKVQVSRGFARAVTVASDWSNLLLLTTYNLSHMFAPKRIAVIGASNKPNSVGLAVVKNLIDSKFSGAVYPVNPKYAEVYGVPAYQRVADTPETPDLAIICTPAATVAQLVHECGEKSIAAVVVISAGFKERGEQGAQLECQLLKTASEFDGLRILGPNCVGFLVPALGLNASFAAAQPAAGSIAVVSQSGALLTAILDWGQEQQIGFSTVISAGNMVDVDFGDLIDYLAQDPQTKSLILYIESITAPRKFMSAARAFARNKPIVVYKAGRFPASAQAAVSHTGAMAGADDVYAAALRRAGAVRVDEIGEVFNIAELLAWQPQPRGPRLAIVTNAGGPGLMAADALLARGGELAQLSVDTITQLEQHMPDSWQAKNPIDLLGDTTTERYEKAVSLVLNDSAVDGLLAILTAQAVTDPGVTAQRVVVAAQNATKPVLGAWMGGAQVRPGRTTLERGQIANYETPELAVGAFMRLVSYARNLETLYETPRALPLAFSVNRAGMHDLLSVIFDEESAVLSESLSKAVLDAYGIPTTKPLPATTVDDAIAAADEIGYPVVIKIHSPDVTHKTDVGGVVTNVSTAAGVRAAFERVTASVKQRQPDARINGVSVQKMIVDPGTELIVGARKDATFGPVVMVGAGGITSELLADRVLELPPLNERLAMRMLEQLRIWPLLKGYRGRPQANIELLIELLIRFSYIVADYPEIAEIEINPLIVGPNAVVAVDARIVIDKSAASTKLPPFSHLAIRPYPEELKTETQLQDGTPIQLRPIKPEDEPKWHEMLAACSQDSIRARFHSLFRTTTHKFATRFCFIDYDREMAFVAEIASGADQGKLIGVGRLLSDADYRRAEYAVLVADPWQGRGLSSQLLDSCLAIANAWGVQEVWGETTSDNPRLISTLTSRGFSLSSGNGTVRASLALRD